MPNVYEGTRKHPDAKCNRSKCAAKYKHINGRTYDLVKGDIYVCSHATIWLYTGYRQLFPGRERKLRKVLEWRKYGRAIRLLKDAADV